MAANSGRRPIRDEIEVTVGLLYFGHRIPLDPNLTMLPAVSRLCRAPRGGLSVPAALAAGINQLPKLPQ